MVMMVVMAMMVVVHHVVVHHVVVHHVVVMVVVMMVIDRRGRQGRDRGETDDHRRGEQQFLKHSLSP
jgi:hypothetical protein